MEEIILRVLYEMNDLNYLMIIITLLTLAMFIFLAVKSRNMWFSNKNFKLMGIFFGMSVFDSVRMSAAWIKFCLVLLYLVMFRPLNVANYFMLLLVGVICSLDFHNLIAIPTGILANIMEIFAVISANIVCSYILDMHPGIVFNIAYVMMSIFIILFGIYLFLTELNNISKGRRLDV